MTGADLGRGRTLKYLGRMPRPFPQSLLVDTAPLPLSTTPPNVPPMLRRQQALPEADGGFPDEGALAERHDGYSFLLSIRNSTPFSSSLSISVFAAKSHVLRSLLIRLLSSRERMRGHCGRGFQHCIQGHLTRKQRYSPMH
jgi:hypothetical protein